MTLFSTLKKNSKLALKDNWGRAILVLLCRAVLAVLLSAGLWIATTLLLEPLLQVPTMEPASLAVNAAFGRRFAVLGVFFLVSLLLSAPMQLGVYYWFRTLVHGKSLPVSGVLTYYQTFRRFGRAVWYAVNLQVRAMLWGILFFAAPVALHLTSLWLIDQAAERSMLLLATMGLCLSAALMLFASVLFLAFMNRYILTAYLLCEDEGTTVLGAFKTSVRYTRGYRFRFLLFGLTFVGWILLSLLTLGFGFIYTGPYIYTSYAMYGRYIIEKNRYVPPNATREFSLAGAEAPPEDLAAQAEPDQDSL